MKQSDVVSQAPGLSASGPRPAVSAVPVSIPDAWEAGAFTTWVATEAGPSSRLVAGWVKHPFALDFRVWGNGDWDDTYSKGWHVTHLPTGHSVCGLLCSRSEAQIIADEIAGMFDWSFTEPERAKGFSAQMQKLRKERDGLVVSAIAAFRPLWSADAVGEADAPKEPSHDR